MYVYYIFVSMNSLDMGVVRKNTVHRPLVGPIFWI